MPFFYSQYLKDEKAKPSGFGRSDPRTASRAAPAPRNNKAPRRSSKGGGGGGTPTAALRSGLAGGRLVWHSNIGATSKASKGQGRGFKPLKYSGDGGKKVVHFSTIEVQPFHFDWTLADDVFYTRRELTAMGQSRFDDAAKLRQQRHLDEKEGDGHGQAVDDGVISKKKKVRDIASLLSMALEDEDTDDTVSIRGIEHFVYPDLQQEMIRRKKEVQREVLDFVRSKRPDPQGWRLAQHSRTFSQWARNVAVEKGMKYCMNNAAHDPEVHLGEEELQQFQRSRDELEASSRELRGSSSFSRELESSQRETRGRSISSGGSNSFEIENSPSAGGRLKEISEDEKGVECPDDIKGGEGKKGEDLDGSDHQAPGIVDTGEG